eukprot:1028896_1
MDTHEVQVFSSIADNMKTSSNPLTSLSKEEWHCKIEWLMNENEFSEHFVLINRVCIAKGGQAKIYLYQPRKAKNENIKTVVKVYKLKYGRKEIQRIWKEFVLIKESKLLYYGSMFYNRSKKEIMITSEPLNYTLKHIVLNKQKHKLQIREYECKLILIEIIDKLYTLHKCGYIHCDLKPSNIMKRNIKKSIHGKHKDKMISNGWKIIDFGAILSAHQCAKIYNHKGKKLIFKYRGTVCWTPPELDIDSVDNRFTYSVDIWALGLIILFILFGKQPYQLNDHETNELCQTKRDRKEYFYKHKLLRKRVKRKHHRNYYYDDVEQDVIKPYDKGQIYICNYLIKLYYGNKISLELFDLLHNHMLLFDPTKRASCRQLYQHKWFDLVRDL